MMKRITIPLRRFCKEYSIGKTKAYQLIRQGQLETLKIGRKRLVLVESANRLIEELLNGRQR